VSDNCSSLAEIGLKRRTMKLPSKKHIGLNSWVSYEIYDTFYDIHHARILISSKDWWLL